MQGILVLQSSVRRQFPGELRAEDGSSRRRRRLVRPFCTVALRPAQIPPGWLKRILEPVKLHVLADKYDVRGLRSLITEKLFEMGKRCMRTNKAAPELEATAYLCDHTSQSSGLRRLFADWYASAAPLARFSSNDSQEWLREHPEAACAIISSLAMARQGPSWSEPTNPFAGEMPENYKDN